MVAGGKHGESRQHHDPLAPDMYKKLGGASVMLRHFARLHEGVKLYGQAEHALREFKLNDPWYVKPTERDGRGWGAIEAICGSVENDCRYARERTRNTGRALSRDRQGVFRHSRPASPAKAKLLIGGFLNHPCGPEKQRCLECMYYLVPRKWRDLSGCGALGGVGKNLDSQD